MKGGLPESPFKIQNQKRYGQYSDCIPFYQVFAGGPIRILHKKE